MACGMKLPKRFREYTSYAIAELEKNKVKWRIDLGKKHYRLLYEVKGKEYIITISKSPSDKREMMNLTSQVKRSLKGLANDLGES